MPIRFLFFCIVILGVYSCTSDSRYWRYYDVDYGHGKTPSSFLLFNDSLFFIAGEIRLGAQPVGYIEKYNMRTGQHETYKYRNGMISGLYVRHGILLARIYSNNSENTSIFYFELGRNKWSELVSSKSYSHRGGKIGLVGEHDEFVMEKISGIPCPGDYYVWTRDTLVYGKVSPPNYHVNSSRVTFVDSMIWTTLAGSCDSLLLGINRRTFQIEHKIPIQENLVVDKIVGYQGKIYLLLLDFTEYKGSIQLVNSEWNTLDVIEEFSMNRSLLEFPDDLCIYDDRFILVYDGVVKKFAEYKKFKEKNWHRVLFHGGNSDGFSFYNGKLARLSHPFDDIYVEVYNFDDISE